MIQDVSAFNCPYCGSSLAWGDVRSFGKRKRVTCGRAVCVKAHKQKLKNDGKKRYRAAGIIFPSQLAKCPKCGKERIGYNTGAADKRLCRDCYFIELKRKTPFKSSRIKWCKYCGKSHNARLKTCGSESCSDRHFKEYDKRYNHQRNADPVKRAKYQQWCLENRRKRYYGNPAYRIRSVVSAGINKRVRRFINGGNAGCWRHLPYTPQQLIKHLEANFFFGMGWHNYGTEWHVDHVKPHSWFNIKEVGDEQFLKAWALSNLMPRFATNEISAKYGNFMIGNCEKFNKYAGKN